MEANDEIKLCLQKWIKEQKELTLIKVIKDQYRRIDPISYMYDQHIPHTVELITLK
jgi:hypothetical protein